MSREPYIDGSTLDEATDAIRAGNTVEAIAGKLNCDPEYLARLIGKDALDSANVATNSDDWDLFATDRLNAVL